MTTTALLLAEPQSEFRDVLERHLRDDGFEVLGASFRSQALTLAEREHPHLVLASDPDLCRSLREGEPGRTWDRGVPVILLAPEEADPVDRLRAFERGADDVLERPFAYDELLARIRAILRRTLPSPLDRIEVGELLVDRPTRSVTLRGERVALAGKEFELLCALAAEPRRVLKKAELLRDIWGFRAHTRTRTLDSHASRLRLKLCRGPDDRYVVNQWGVGYKLVD